MGVTRGQPRDVDCRQPLCFLIQQTLIPVIAALWRRYCRHGGGEDTDITVTGSKSTRREGTNRGVLVHSR